MKGKKRVGVREIFMKEMGEKRQIERERGRERERERE